MKTPRLQPEVLPGADAEKDCSRPEESLNPLPEAVDKKPAGIEITDLTSTDITTVDDNDDEEDEEAHLVNWRAVSGAAGGNGLSALAAWQTPRGRFSIFLERIALLVERATNRITGLQMNPFYHTGAIALFLLAVVGATGVYLFMFFQYGYDASYQAVARMEGQFIARIIRAVHRYASGALVIVTLLHAYRTLFLEKFRGPRWLAWLTGLVMTAFLWVAGVTGYWLIWDARAQVIADSFRQLFDRVSGWTPLYMSALLTAGERRTSWTIFLILFAIHVILFLLVAGFFVLHILRLRRPKWLPPVRWVAAVTLAVLVVSALFPVGMLPQADLTRLPDEITIDPLFLFYLPFGGSLWFWAALSALVAFFALLPWIHRRHRPATVEAWGAPEAVLAESPGTVSRWAEPRVRIIKDRCTGCTKCALDCPYGAIEMVERHDGRPHKFIALEDPARCVSCGICVGSCDGVAVTLGATAPESLWGDVADRINLVEMAGTVESPLSANGRHQTAGSSAPARAAVGSKVVFTCERHAAHGARPYLEAGGIDSQWTVIALPCVGVIPPDMLVRALDEGASEIRVIGCPPDDCANREGNLWTEQRLTRQRVPRLRREYAGAPILAAWLPPDQFDDGLEMSPPPSAESLPDYLNGRRMMAELTWRQFVPAVLLLAAALAAQILLTDLPFRPFPVNESRFQFLLTEPAAPFGNATAGMLPDDAYRLQMVVDGDVVADHVYPAEELLSTTRDPRPLFVEQRLAPGNHHVYVAMTGDVSGATHILYDETVSADAGQILRPPFSWSIAPACRRGAWPGQSLFCRL